MSSSMPKHPVPRGVALTARQARFVEYGDLVVLTDTDGNNWPIEYVSILGALGSGVEGQVKLPRPWRYGPTGEVLIRGDYVWLDFDHGNPKRPVVVGVVRELRASDFLPERHDVPGADPNRYAARLVPRDAAGAEAGRVDLEVARTGSGTVHLTATGEIVVTSGEVTFTVTPSGVTVRRGTGATPAVVPVLLATPFEGDAAAWATILEAFIASCSTAVTAAQIAGYAVTAKIALEGAGFPAKLGANQYGASRLSSE